MSEDTIGRELYEWLVAMVKISEEYLAHSEESLPPQKRHAQERGGVSTRSSQLGQG